MKQALTMVLFWCVAQTQCYDGFILDCRVQGSVWNQCWTFVTPGQYVECNGIDAWGRWVQVWRSCGVNR